MVQTNISSTWLCSYKIQDTTEMQAAYRNITLPGIYAICGDIIYKGARSINGPNLFHMVPLWFSSGPVTGARDILRVCSSSDLRQARGCYALLLGFHYWWYAILIAIPLLVLTRSREMSILLFIL
jgi:hypothetical protein